MRLKFNDAGQQQAYEFLVGQIAYIETTVYQRRYPDIQYPSLIPIDSSAGEWAQSIIYYSADSAGEADWFSHLATDMNLADVSMEQFSKGIEMGGIGYSYTLQELNIAQQLNRPLTADKGNAARRRYEEFVDRKALRGDTAKGWEGLINNSNVTRVDAANDGTGPSRLWSTKTGDQILRDINDVLSAVWTESNTVELADTLLLGPTRWIALGTRRLGSNTDTSIWEYIMKNNAYTMKTGLPLTIRSVLGLDTAGSGSTSRMVAYMRDPDVVKMHIPMRHRFLNIWQRGPMRFDVPGIFRLGQLEIRRPGAVRYVDGI